MKINITKMFSRRKRLMIALSGGLLLLAGAIGCSKSQSYSDLLKEEEKSVNWYLSNQRVLNELPADDNFETGPEAPFYKMDEEGYVYMQVLECGEEPVESGDKVYFLYERWNIKNLYEIGASQSDSNRMNGSLSNFYFFMGDTSSGNGAYFGSGLQVPLKYLGYHSEVNLVLKSNQGFSIDQSECTPYLINVKYLKPEY